MVKTWDFVIFFNPNLAKLNAHHVIFRAQSVTHIVVFLGVVPAVDFSPIPTWG
jgi:hypothetical protein